MKINQLRSLMAIQQEGSISGAAKIMNLSVPAITKSMTNLEEEFGMTFIDRSSYRAGLNEYGKHLALHANGIMKAIDDAKLSLYEMQKGREKQLLVDVAPVLVAELVPKAIVQLRKSIPGATVQFDTFGPAQPSELIGNLLKGESDILLCPILPGMELTGLSYEPLAKVHLNVIASKNHPVLRSKHITMGSLIQYDWIVPTLLGDAFDIVKQMFADFGEPVPSSLLAAPSRQAVLNMLRYGEFLAILPCNEELFSLDKENIEVIDIDCSSYSWTYFILQRTAGYKSDVQRAFIRELKDLVTPIAQTIASKKRRV